MAGAERPEQQAGHSAVPAGVDAQLDRQIGDLLKDAGVAATATADPPTTSAASAQDEARLVKQLDRMLASIAEEAIAADVQTVDLPIPSTQPPETPAQAPAPTAQVAETLPLDEQAPPAAQGSSDGGKPDDTPAQGAVGAVADAPAAASEAPARGAAAPPQPAQPSGTAATASAFNATAQDVARELEDDKKASDATGMPAPKGPEGKVAQTPTAGEVPVKQPSRSLVGQWVWDLCAALSRPVGGLSPQLRAVLGYVALATLINGLLLTAWGLLKMLS